MDQTDVATRMRQGLRRLAKAVVIVTAQHEGVRIAMAATAVSELSLDPPSMLVCVNKGASIHPILSVGADFCINILHSSQRDVAAACGGAAKGEARFLAGNWAPQGSRPPHLSDAQASFFCRNVSSMAYGTHSIFIGEVEDVAMAGDVDPLVYVDGRYASISGAKVSGD